MFLHLPVIHSVHGGEGFHPGGAMKEGTVKDPPPRGRSTSGRYASYWNAFLFELVSTFQVNFAIIIVIISGEIKK